MSEATRIWISAWEGRRVTADDIRELDGERVLVLIRLGGRGKTSGLDLEQTQTRAAQLFHVRAGKVTRFAFYFDRDRALADLGFASESGDSG
jgi:ketosteroid isomerase-like protein